MTTFAVIENAEVVNIVVASADYIADGCVRIPEEFEVLIGDGYDGEHFTRNGMPLKTNLEIMTENYVQSQSDLATMTEDALDIADQLVNDDIELEMYRAIYGPLF